VVSFYALIHLPLGRPAGTVRPYPELAAPGRAAADHRRAQTWTGTERHLGADMFWDHADTSSYLG